MSFMNIWIAVKPEREFHMKKLSVLFFILLCTGLLWTGCFAEDMSSGDYSFTALPDDTVEITGYTGNETNLKIPSELDGLPVTSIASSVFSQNSDLVTVTIPESVISLGNGVFAECTSLREVILPDGLLSIGNLVFQGCTALEKAVLPASLVRIGWNPFDRCDKITAVELSGFDPFYTVEQGVLFDVQTNMLVSYPTGRQDHEYTIPEWVTEIGHAAFSENTKLLALSFSENLTILNGNPFCGCTGLQHIFISALNPVYTIKSGSLYNTRTNELVSYLWGSDNSSYRVPNGTVSLAREAFYRHTELTSVRLPNSLTKIDDAAFAESGLTSIEIPANVVSLGNSTFSNCASLKTVSLPSGLTWIGDSAFYACEALESITLPDSLTTIGVGAFMHCSSLTEIVLPENVRIIDDFAFALCEKLEKADFPSRIFVFGRGSFYGDEHLTASVFPGSLAQEWAEANNIKYTLKDINYITNDAI